MQKIKLNYFIDLLMAIFFVFTAVSGIVLFFFVPGGQRRAGHQEFWGISRHSWVDFHNLSGLILLLLILVHLLLHWRCFLEMPKIFFSRKKESCELGK